MRDSLSYYKENWQHCSKCSISEIAHKKVFPTGTFPCDVLYIGLAPGKTENVLGQPFVGKAGSILRAWIAETLKDLSYNGAITNLILCRPCDGLGMKNRDPSEKEIENCSQHLEEVLEIAKPKLIVLLGRVAKTVFHTTYNGRFDEDKILDLYHPAYVLRSGGSKSGIYAECLEELIDFLSKNAEVEVES